MKLTQLFRVFPATPKDGDMKQAAMAIAPVAMAALEAQINALKEVSVPFEGAA
jgi:hypothetical protein